MQYKVLAQFVCQCSLTGDQNLDFHRTLKKQCEEMGALRQAAVGVGYVKLRIENCH
jgi:hypothetical protein